MMKYRWLKHFYVSSWLIFRFFALFLALFLILIRLARVLLLWIVHAIDLNVHFIIFGFFLFFFFHVFPSQKMWRVGFAWAIFFNQSMNRWQNSLDFQTCANDFWFFKLTMVFTVVANETLSLSLFNLIWFNQIERNMLTNSGQFTFISIICYLLVSLFIPRFSLFSSQ